MLVKKNAILWTIVTTHSFSNINLKNTVHGFWTNQCLEIRNYSLNKEEKFNSIRITIIESHILIDFFTSSDKYMKNTKFYFGTSGISENQSPYAINDMKVSSNQKKLGKFDIGLELPISVEITNSSVYGNVIGLTIYR